MVKVGDLWVLRADSPTYRVAQSTYTDAEGLTQAHAPYLETEYVMTRPEEIVLVLDMGPIEKEFKRAHAARAHAAYGPIGQWICRVLLEEKPALVSVLDFRRKVSK